MMDGEGREDYNIDIEVNYILKTMMFGKKYRRRGRENERVRVRERKREKRERGRQTKIIFMQHIGTNACKPHKKFFSSSKVKIAFREGEGGLYLADILQANSTYRISTRKGSFVKYVYLFVDLKF